MNQRNEVPDVHADVVQVALTDTSIILGFRSVQLEPRPQHDDEDREEVVAELKAIVRLSTGDAKAFAIMLRRAIKSFEERNGVVALPAQFAEQVMSSEDEW